jgi:hypothetical protein
MADRQNQFREAHVQQQGPLTRQSLTIRVIAVSSGCVAQLDAGFRLPATPRRSCIGR